MKECSRCHKVKRKERFSLRRASKDKLQTWCKDCISDYGQEHKEEIHLRKLEYYRKNSQRILSQRKKKK